MKETIYTIPVNEAYATDCECPLCELERKLETEAVEYSLGPAMMEPDFRTESNEKGYCNKHFKMMFQSPNKLPLALVLDTHLDEVRNKLDALKNTAENALTEKRGMFKKGSTADVTEEASQLLSKLFCNCMVCEKVNHTMERYVDVLLYMWATDDEFKAKFDRSKGVCLKHLKMLTEGAKTSLKAKDKNPFLATLLKKECSELSRIQEDIHKFTLKFDYRNADMEWGTAKDAPERTIEKLSGYME